MPKRIDETNKKYGHWTVLYYDNDSQKNKSGGARWICRCDCGKIKSVLGTELKRGKIKSCGCGPRSWGEKKIGEILKDNNIPYLTEYIFKDCYYKDHTKPLRFDFFVENKYVIEFDGKQHYEIGSFSETKEELLDLQQRDSIKNNYCFKNNILIIRIPYFHLEKISLDDLKLDTSTFILKKEVMPNALVTD